MTLTDGSILRRIGLQLQRDECGVARPQPVEGRRSEDVAARASLPFEGRRSASVPTAACAWCDAEAGIKPHPGMNQSHGICAEHLAKIKADMERRAA